MKKYIFMAVAAIAALSGCTSDNDFEENQTGKQTLVFTATMENSEGSRATYNSTEKYAEWQAGDQISINGMTYSAQEAGAVTTFKADSKGAEEGDTYKAYFPAELYDGTTAALPATQAYKAGEFNMPMYAESTTSELEFKNLCSVLTIKVTSEDIATLKSIKVASDKVMSGTFTIGSDGQAVMSEDGKKTVVLESSTALSLDEDGTVFYIAIPAQKYAYLNIFLSPDGKTYTQAMATKKYEYDNDHEVVTARSKIYTIDYKKNATKLYDGNILFADLNIGDKDWRGHTYDERTHFVWGAYENIDNIYDLGCDHKEWELGDHDTATNNWGINWRMPTLDEFRAINDYCTIEWSSRDGYDYTEGCQCNGQEGTIYEGNNIFLPAAGSLNHNFEEIDGMCRGEKGAYWTSTSMDDSFRYGIYFDKSECESGWGSLWEYVRPGSDAGNCVRAVLEEQ